LVFKEYTDTCAQQYEWLRQLSSQPENTVVGLARTVAPVIAKLSADGITNVHVIQADMADHKYLNVAAVEVSNITNGFIDYLIVNGAFSDPATTKVTPTSIIGCEDALRKDMISSLEVNVLGVIYSINAFLPFVREGNVKKIIAMSTGLADPDAVMELGIRGTLTYSTMKAALNMVVAKYAIELKSEGITLLALSPGLVNTRETPRKLCVCIQQS
jgi:NAD(P)-dependent dehydrogenase (short-subunit alcohol dehydrogenase family)